MVVSMNRDRFRRTLLALVLTAVTAASAFPQTAATLEEAGEELRVFSRPRFMLFFFEAEPGVFSNADTFLLYNSLLASVAAANPDVVVVESPDADVPQTKVGREDLAQRVNADSWLRIVATGGLDNLTIQAETFDILRQETIGEELIRPGFSIDYRVLARGFWDGIVETIRTEYTRLVDLTDLELEGVPESEVIGPPGGPFQLSAAGTLSEQIPYSAAFTLRVQAPGYYAVERPLFAGIEPIRLALDQVRLPRYGVDARISSLQFPGSRFWLYPLPARVFVRAGFTTQLVGFYFLDNSPQILVPGANSLTFLEIDGGLYVIEPEQLLGAYVGLGGYLRITHPPASGFGIDTAGAPGAIVLSSGIEFSPSRRFRFFAEYQPAFILADSPQEFINLSFVANRFPSGRVPGPVLLDWGLFDLRNFSLGLRIDLGGE
jgi:hypothetical protein